MRIAVISEYLDSTGGTPTILSNLVSHLDARYPDAKIEVIASQNLYRGDEKLPAREKLGAAPVVRLKTPKSNRDSTALRLLAGLCFTGSVFWRLLTRRRYDILLIVTNPPTLPMAIRAIKQIKKTPYLYLVHDLYPDVAVALGVLKPESRLNSVFHQAQKKWMHSADKVLVLGRDMSGHLMENYQLPAAQIEVVPNWCDPQQVRPLKESRFRQDHDLQGVVALYAGNFGHYQTFEELLDAAALLRDAHPEICLVLVGGGAQDEYIRRRVDAEKLTNVRVFPMVSQREYPDVLCAADIALVTLARGAETAGVPSKFYNILASGRPTIAVVAKRAEVSLVVQEANCGIQIDHEQPQVLADALIRLANSPTQREEMGDNARAVLVEKYTLDRVGSQFYHALKNAAKTANFR